MQLQFAAKAHSTLLEIKMDQMAYASNKYVGKTDLRRQIPQTIQNHKTPETEHGLAVNRIFPGNLFGRPGSAGPLYCRVCMGGSYVPENDSDRSPVQQWHSGRYYCLNASSSKQHLHWTSLQHHQPTMAQFPHCKCTFPKGRSYSKSQRSHSLVVNKDGIFVNILASLTSGCFIAVLSYSRRRRISKPTITGFLAITVDLTVKFLHYTIPRFKHRKTEYLFYMWFFQSNKVSF